MKSRIMAIFWGLMLVGAGAAALLQQAGMIDLELIPGRFAGLAFGALSAFFFLTWFLEGTHKWGWLFPACILGALP